MGAALRKAWKDPETRQFSFTTPLGLELAARASKATPQFPPAVPGLPPPPAQASLGNDAQGESKTAARKRKRAEAKAAAAKKQKDAEGKPKQALARKTPDGKDICYPFNQGGCKKNDCRFVHACRMCFATDHGFNSCPQKR